MTLVILVVAALPVPAQAAAAQGHTPVSGATFEAVLSRLFPSHQDLAKGARFAITLRFLPPFAAESQIGIVYGIDSKATATIVTLSNSLGRTLNDAAATGAQADTSRFASLVQAKTERAFLDSGLTRQWLTTFWSSVSALAKTGPAIALRHDGTREVDVTLDPTIYEVFYSDPENDLRLSIQGPDPEWSGDLEKLDPVVKWMLLVRREVLQLTSNAGREKRPK